MPDRPLRLIDLHCDWLLQYASEITTFDRALYQGAEKRLGQAEGYLNGTRAAVFSCFRRDAEWKTLAKPWSALDALIARIEAEFSGRLLIGPEDHSRWADDPDGLCWGIIGVEGFDHLVVGPEDLQHLGRLFDRGVRLFQPIYGRSSQLGGSSEQGDDRGLTDLGKRFVEELCGLGSNPDGPRPILDLAHCNPRTMSDVLGLLENDASKLDRIGLTYSHGAIDHEGCATPRALSLDNLKRLRGLGGYVGLSVGPPFYASKEALKAGIETVVDIPFRGQTGYNGIAIGTDFLGVDQTLDGLANVPEVVEWIDANFPRSDAERLIAKNGETLIGQMVGA